MKIRPLLLAASAAAALSFSGCGEDSSTELRVHLLTMINALDGNISAHHFYGDITPLAPKTSLDDDYEDVSEAPSIWYTLPVAPDTKVGKVTISQGHLINAYIAANCIDDNSVAKNHIYHTPTAGSINIVNTTDIPLNVDVGGSATNFPACGVKEFEWASLSGEDNVTFSYSGQDITVPLPKNAEVFDIVIFPDYSFKKYDIKSVKP